MQTLETFDITDWNTYFTDQQQEHALAALEEGKVIFFPQLAFHLQDDEQTLLSPEYVDPNAKNISFDSQDDSLRGAQGPEDIKQQLQTLIKRFANQAQQFIHQLFPLYQSQLRQARTSLRPVEISNRKTSYRKDDKRLHVDAFPANPNQGKRILRLFSNINLHGQDRVWRLGEPFEKVAARFLPSIKHPLPGSAYLLKALRITKSYRTEYDHIMLQIHDRMKADENYQQTAAQSEIRFPPNSTWIVQTDQVSHAAMSGRQLLEQTFYLPVTAMKNSWHSPLKILERLTGRTLI